VPYQWKGYTDEHNTWDGFPAQLPGDLWQSTKDTQIMTIPLQLKGILWTKNWLQEAERTMVGRVETFLWV
jgi:hypothetical protein